VRRRREIGGEAQNNAFRLVLRLSRLGGSQGGGESSNENRASGRRAKSIQSVMFHGLLLYWYGC